MDIQERILEEVADIKNQGYNAICFWLPAFNVGGGTYYLCQLAIYLSQHTDLKIYYMDYEDGYPSQLLEGSGVTILKYCDEDTDFSVDDPCVMVTNSTRAIQLKRMNPYNKLLFWHYETVPCAWDSVFILGEGERYLRLCNEEKAMLFHDWSARDILNQTCHCDFNRSYLPLFLAPKQVEAKQTLLSDEEINIVCLGRLGHEKIYSLFNLITNLADYQTERKKVLYIVGDGPYRAQVEDFCTPYKNKINFIFEGTIPKNRLDYYLLSHADVVFAMGLSTLEGASLKIPSVVVQLDTEMIRDNEFFWLFDSKEYCVGIMPEQKRRFNVAYNKFRDIMDDLYIYGEKAVLAQKCYDYYLKYHSDFDSIVAEFLRYISESSLTMGKLENCIKYIPYNHLKVQRTKILKWEFSPKIIFNGV